MSKFLVVLLSLFLVLQASPCYADSYVELAPTFTTSYGVTSGSVSGVVGACASWKVTSGSALMNVNCSGDVGAHSFSGTALTASGLTSGQCVQAGTGGVLTTTGSACASGGGSQFYTLTGGGAQIGLPGIGGGKLSNQSYTGSQLFAPIGFTVGHLFVSCAAYNASDAGGNSPYNPLDSSGLGGATVHFGITNGTYTGESPLNLGTVVIPTSPQAGPWVTSVVASSSISYTVAAGDGFVVTVSSASTNAQTAIACTPGVGT